MRAMRASAVLVGLATFTLTLTLSAAQREHKVHNIVLYPHKHSWCKTTAIKQVVAYPGCEPVEVENNVCMGGCFSYSIPRTIPSSPGEVVPYCDSCQPSSHSWKQVALNCTTGDYEGDSLTKMVQIIENCTCTKCSDQLSSSLLAEMADVGEDEVEEALKESLSPAPNKPQLIDIMDTTPHRYGNYTFVSNATNSNDSLINQRTMVLLGELSNTDGDEVTGNQVELQEILHHVEGEDHKINGAVLKNFVRKVEEMGHINVNLEHLQRVLERLEHAENKLKNGHRHQHMLVGPHHSLVLPRDGEQTPEMFLKPTLDMPSHLLKPAHEGSELSYHNTIIPADQADSLDAEIE